MDSVSTILWLLATVALVVANGFFVAAEFALVKVRPSRLANMVRQQRFGASTAQWLLTHLDHALSACQLGITVASLALGWIGEPAIARLLDPLFHAVGITSAAWVHGLSFVVGFALITAAHLVLGEQAPKIFAIRRPEPMALWCAVPLRWFYVISYPLLRALSWATAVILGWFGVEGAEGHELHSEAELRALLTQAHAQGELTRTELRLLDAVFDFDDTVCRQIMLPRVKIQFIDLQQPLSDIEAAMQRSMHTRYPACEGGLDRILGFVHVKDFAWADRTAPDFDLRSIIRPPKYVPETMPVSRMLGLFRSTRQHIAFVVDEYGAVVGMVTLENVLELIVGEVQDEFDDETPAVVPDGPNRFLVDGSARLELVNRVIGAALVSDNVETIGGLLSEVGGRIVTAGDRVDLDGWTAEIVEMRHAAVARVRLIQAPAADST